MKRVDVLGCGISEVNETSFEALLLERLGAGGGGYVCFVNSHLCVEGREEPDVQAALNGSFMSVADGAPVYWYGRLKGGARLGRVPGPDSFERFLRLHRTPSLRHYFLGGKPEVLARLLDKVRSDYPTAEVAGAHSPPFRALTAEEQREILDRIRRAKPDLVWVGLGAPKQERWMADNWLALRPSLLLGVGAGFDFLSGTIPRAPKVYRRWGMEWLYRLFREPRRLWRRYLYTNTMFVLYGLYDSLLK